jgi:hypothetical protein
MHKTDARMLERLRENFGVYIDIHSTQACSTHCIYSNLPSFPNNCSHLPLCIYICKSELDRITVNKGLLYIQFVLMVWCLSDYEQQILKPLDHIYFVQNLLNKSKIQAMHMTFLKSLQKRRWYQKFVNRIRKETITVVWPHK